MKYIPKRAGQINEETEYVLNRFGMQPPGYLSNIGTQIKDMDIRMSPEADKSMSLKNAWDLMMEKSIVSLPIRDREGQLEGLITIGDIAKTYMDTTDSYLLSRAKDTVQKNCRDNCRYRSKREMSMDILQKEKFWWELQIRKCSKPILNRMT